MKVRFSIKKQYSPLSLLSIPNRGSGPDRWSILHQVLKKAFRWVSDATHMNPGRLVHNHVIQCSYTSYSNIDASANNIELLETLPYGIHMMTDRCPQIVHSFCAQHFPSGITLMCQTLEQPKIIKWLSLWCLKEREENKKSGNKESDRRRIYKNYFKPSKNLKLRLDYEYDLNLKSKIGTFDALSPIESRCIWNN